MAEHKTLWIHLSNGQDYPIKLAKNQKIIQIHKVNIGINYSANMKALNKLSANAFVLYMYLLDHDEMRLWALSSKDVINKTSLSKNTYPNAVNELIEKGFLEEKSIDIGQEQYSENTYHFWEDPENKVEHCMPYRFSVNDL